MKKYLCLTFGAVTLDILTIPALLFSFLLGYANLFLISFLSVLIHELAHIFSAKAVGVRISRLEIHPFGVCAVLKDGYINNSEKEFIIAFAGPFTSLFLALSTALFKPPCWEYIFDINICICALNLLPILPLDGGRMIKSMLTYKLGILKAYNLSQKFGKLLIAVLFPLSVGILIKTGFNFSYVLITAFLIGNVRDQQRNITLITLKEILENPQKTQKIRRTKFYTASENDYARKILRLISYDYFITVNTTKNGKITAVLTEEQILNSLLSGGINSTFADIVQSSGKSDGNFS